jgi:hypothetical protein
MRKVSFCQLFPRGAGVIVSSFYHIIGGATRVRQEAHKTGEILWYLCIIDKEFTAQNSKFAKIASIIEAKKSFLFHFQVGYIITCQGYILQFFFPRVYCKIKNGYIYNLKQGVKLVTKLWKFEHFFP